MFQILMDVFLRGKLKQRTYITYRDTVCASCFFTGNIKKAWNIISETIVAEADLGMSDKMMKVFLMILDSYESCFKDTECRNLLKQAMADWYKCPAYGDILAVGMLIYWETHNTAFSEAKVDSETLMSKATHCMKIWTDWFLSVGKEILQQESNLRVMLSLKFLRTVAELAIVNFQNFMAVTTLSYASRVAHILKHEDIVRNVTRTIVSLIPKMGLEYVPSTYCHDPEKEDVFMDSMGLEKDGGLLCLTAIATHHLITGQLHKFVLVRDAIYSQLPECPLVGEIETVIPFAKAVILRLEAEFLMVPVSRRAREMKDCIKPMQNALNKARSSYQHIHFIYSLFGHDFPRVKAAHDTVGFWEFIHEYLCTIQLTGELLVYTGLNDEAKKLLLRGLRVADNLKLVTWAAIFSSRLTEHALISDDMKDATDMLQKAQSFLKYRKPTLELGLHHCHEKPRIHFVSSAKLTCGFKMSGFEMGDNSFSCQYKEDLEQHIFSNLLKETEPGRCEMDDDPNYLILTDIKASCSCCQIELVSVCIHLMRLQAEILWRQQKSICSVSHFLERSLNMAHRLVSIVPCSNVINFIVESGWKVCRLSQGITSTRRTLAESAQKCAEIYVQNLYMRSAEVQTACDHVEANVNTILSLLDIVEAAGKKASGFHTRNIFVASALLTRSHCDYITVLRTLPDDDFQEDNIYDRIQGASDVFQEREGHSSYKCFSSVLSTVFEGVCIAVAKKQKWDSKRSWVLLSVKSDQPLETFKMTELVDVLDNTDFDSSVAATSVAASSHHTDKQSWFKQLTKYFPSLAAYQNVTHRIRYLQTAIKQLHEFPHSLLYRQISQSLALCLWEKQMIDVWRGTNETSSVQTEIAAHLTESMHVTFQHMMTDNFCNKLSMEKTWEGHTKREALIDKQATKEALNVLRFGGDVMENFKDRLASIPDDWTVVQLTIVNFDPTKAGKGQIFITRLNCAREPITVGLPNYRHKFLKIAQTSYAKCAFGCHAMCLPWKHLRMMETLLYQQEVFLCGYKWLLRGQLDCVRQDCVLKFLDAAGWRAVSTILQQHGYHICYTELRNLLEILLGANESDVLSLVECMYPPHVTGTLTQICMTVQKDVLRICGDQWSENRGPVILILDNELIFFPWESMIDFASDQVTRIPSFVSLSSLLTWHRKMTRSPFKSGVKRTSVTAHMYDMGNCIPEHYQQLIAELKQNKGWRIVTGHVAWRFEKLFQNSSLYLYYGHGWQDYTYVQNTFGKALAILLGCNTGLLKATKRMDGQGAPLYFLLAGCPAFVGNNTVSYAHESTRLISKLSSCWVSQSSAVSVRQLLVEASCATGNFGTCGTRLVIYGLPVMMN